MTEEEQLKTLFKAFRDRNEHAFYRVAEGIIADQLAANRHGLASELQHALGKETARPASSHGALRSVPRDRRNGDDLLVMRESLVDHTQIVLSRDARAKVERLLVEHRNEYVLAEHGLSAKRKLLFWGPPGCGKTFTAYYIAHELGVPIAVIHLHALISSFLGDTASNLQRVFDIAASRPMVLLFDEVDAIGKQRDDPNDVGELKRVVNSLLQAIDSYTGKSVLIAATNHQYLLDPALWRRFDDVVPFPAPTQAERQTFLKRTLGGVRITGSLATVAERTNDASYDDLRRGTVEALKTMVLSGKKSISTTDILTAVRGMRHVTKSGQRRTR
jgi:SpoVK/Ycf46/Vps4 family AAA+-type ATPase